MAHDQNEVVKPVDGKKLRALIKSNNDAKKKAAEVTGDIGPETKAFAEVYSLNTKAITLIGSIDRMSDDKRQDFMRSLQRMMPEMLDYWGFVDTPDMFDQAAANADNVTQLDTKKADIAGKPKKAVAAE